ncbi:O-antigen ligase family protein [Paenibacillus contaminans]|uniref:O-antigen ligase domain-containing protein n=1 Tax=Paenibacillus contaminans TaxID=450362 RepID=A0A329M3N7_9BACL|nr:O-antigen ligase family protein [Paenibacillus contaminans]RAV13796.1 O-antigen ligase domain-containing protein [Paenibacillus contaminans]
MYGKTKQYGKAPAAVPATDNQSMTLWGALGIVVIFLFWAPFQRGLFNGYTSDFDSPIISSFVWTSILMILIAIFLYFQWKLKEHKDVMALAVWLLPLSYLLSSFNAASGYFSTNMIYLHIMYALFFVIGVYLTRNPHGNQLLQGTIMISGYVIVWFGLFYWFGSPRYEGNFIYTVFNWFGLAHYRDAVMGDEFNGYRLTSAFQYANTYAAFLMAILLGCLLEIVKSKKWHYTLLHAFMLVPICISFIVTLSRGALVLLPIILLLSLFLFRLHRQILIMVYTALALIATFIILSPVTTIGEDLYKQFSASASWKGWLIVLGASAVLSAIIAIIQMYGASWLQEKLNKYNGSRFAVLAIPVASIILGGLAAYLLFGNTGVTKFLPETIKNRIENINFAQHSVLERGTFYKDSFKLIKDYPLLGAGGGGWAALYEKYQNNPYTSRQAHNFYLQYIVEIGIIGTLILTLFICFVFYLFVRFFLKKDEEQRDRRIFYALVTISILIHSIIDFNMSYAYIAVLLFLCMGGMIAESEEGNGKLLAKIKSGYHKGFPIALGLLAIVFLVISLRMLSADRLYTSAVAGAQQNNKPFQEIMLELDKAIDRNPKHPDYMLFKANLLSQAYQQTKDEKFYSDLGVTIQKIKQTEPINRYVMEAQYNQNILKSNFLDARNVLIDGLKNFPWELSIYERLIALDVQLGNESRNENNINKTDQYWNHALELYNGIVDRTKELALLPKEQGQGREFYVTKTIAFNVGQIHFIRGEFPAASEILKLGVTDQLDDQQIRMNIRWYLASLQKQQKNDQELYNKLIAKDANEANEIQKLVTANLLVQ